MEFSEVKLSGDVQILNRHPFEGVPMTLDFSGVSGDVVKAGTPIGPNGTADNTATVVGILLHDVSKARPQGTLLKKAYINTAVAKANSGVTISSDVKAALPMVVFE